MKKYIRKVCIALVLILLFSLSSCASFTVADTSINLAKNYYYVQNNAKERFISAHNDPSKSDIRLVDAYVDKIAMDNDHIYAQQLELDKSQSPSEVKQGALPAYYVIIVESGEVLGPMNEAEFDEWYTSQELNVALEWISTKNKPALIDRLEELNPEQSYE